MTDSELLTYTGSYEQAVSYLNSIPRFVKQNKDTVQPKGLLKRLGVRMPTSGSASASFLGTGAFCSYLKEQGVIPDVTDKVFHVAGTNGKGSVCAFLKSIHMAMGRRVGVFTSPHLIDIRERITIDDEMISEEDFYDSFMTVMSYLKEFKSHGPFADYSPVFFDWLFFIAVVYFGQKMPDAVIWETGLGGRYDATNTIRDKSVSVITEIGLDHMEILGDTKEKIAIQKAGIIQSGVPVVTVKKDESVLKVIENEAEAKKSPLVVVPNARDTLKKMSDKGIDFSYESHYYNNATLEVVGHALYQVENAALAAAAMEMVYSREDLPFECIYEGIKNMHHPGRMEEVAGGVYFDGAHNVDGIEALIDSVEGDGCPGSRYMIFSAVSDKQADKELDMIAASRLFKKVCIVPVSGSRGRSHDELVHLTEVLSDAGTDCELIEDLKTAYEEYRGMCEEQDRLYVCGSLYLIGELKEMIR